MFDNIKGFFWISYEQNRADDGENTPVQDKWKYEYFIRLNNQDGPIKTIAL